jgi:hypothetical protein
MFGNVQKNKALAKSKSPIKPGPKAATQSGRKPNLNVGPRIDTGNRAKTPDLDTNLTRKTSLGPSASKANAKEDSATRQISASGLRIPEYVGIAQIGRT